MNRLKKLTLTFSSLLVVAFSFCFTKNADAAASFQSKRIEFQLTAIADDVDDDFGDPQIETMREWFIHATAFVEPSPDKNHPSVFDPRDTSIPFYLQIRNLRI